jgi:hypothetical protein
VLGDEIDVPLYKLNKMIGKRKAEESYRLCMEAIPELKTICERILILRWGMVVMELPLV